MSKVAARSNHGEKHLATIRIALAALAVGLLIGALLLP